MNVQGRVPAVCVLLFLFLPSCTIIQDSLTRIPVPPFGDSWFLEVTDLNKAMILSEKFIRGNKSEYFSLAKVTETRKEIHYESTGPSYFSSGNIAFYLIDIFYSTGITEIKSNRGTGVAMYVSESRYSKSDEKTLFIYPDNSQQIWDQIGCKFLIKDQNQTEFIGDAFLGKQNSNKQELNVFPKGYEKQGTCSLKKTPNVN
jgi:hypothetical protein